VAQGTKKISRNIVNVLEATSDAGVKSKDVFNAEEMLY
jgi:hypothetical protein|tara:strand:- start:642 stop:755 length:114 start_codon:yes stop_codon:yes gene_type:complete